MFSYTINPAKSNLKYFLGAFSVIVLRTEYRLTPVLCMGFAISVCARVMLLRQFPVPVSIPSRIRAEHSG